MSATGKALQPCGTPAAYQRHVRAAEPACDPCRDAQARYIAALRAESTRMREQDRKNTRAHNRAKQRLADAHRDEYEGLLLEEKQREWTA